MTLMRSTLSNLTAADQLLQDLVGIAGEWSTADAQSRKLVRPCINRRIAS